MEKPEDCVFCDMDRQLREGHILFQSSNFYVKAAPFGAMGPGHVLLVSKQHLNCYGEMPSANDSEFLDERAPQETSLL